MTSPAIYALENLQSILVKRLALDDMFAGNQSANGAPIPIVTEQKGDLVTQIQTSIDQLGLCLVVMTPLFEFVKEQAPSLDGWALISVDVYENVTLNPTGIRALSAAQRVLALMHHYPGEWDPALDYLPGDRVHRRLVNYVAISGTTGVDPDKDGFVHWGFWSGPQFIGLKRPLSMISEGPPLHYALLFTAHLALSTPQP